MSEIDEIFSKKPKQIISPELTNKPIKVKKIIKKKSNEEIKCDFL